MSLKAKNPLLVQLCILAHSAVVRRRGGTATTFATHVVLVYLPASVITHECYVRNTASAE
jgi:hypothetical protein